MQTLLDNVELVPFEDFKREYDRAMEIMEPVDENDAPFLAVGLALGIEGIWTEDRHFLQQDLLNVYSTGDLIGKI
jgi:predicted nucleic acid-binding protein